MSFIRKIGSKITEKKRRKEYARQFRKAHNIQETQQEKLVRERKEERREALKARSKRFYKSIGKAKRGLARDIRKSEVFFRKSNKGKRCK